MVFTKPIPIDLEANQKFLDGVVEKQLSNVNESNGKSVIKTAVTGSYLFSWGHIVEQLSGNFFIWKFQISALASIDEGEKRIFQEQIFNYLQERHPDYTSEYAILVASLHDRCIFPGVKEDDFIIASPMQYEYRNRIWVHMHILSQDIPELLSRYINSHR